MSSGLRYILLCLAAQVITPNGQGPSNHVWVCRDGSPCIKHPPNGNGPQVDNAGYICWYGFPCYDGLLDVLRYILGLDPLLLDRYLAIAESATGNGNGVTNGIGDNGVDSVDRGRINSALRNGLNNFRNIGGNAGRVGDNGNRRSNPPIPANGINGVGNRNPGFPFPGASSIANRGLNPRINRLGNRGTSSGLSGNGLNDFRNRGINPGPNRIRNGRINPGAPRDGSNDIGQRGFFPGTNGIGNGGINPGDPGNGINGIQNGRFGSRFPGNGINDFGNRSPDFNNGRNFGEPDNGPLDNRYIPFNGFENGDNNGVGTPFDRRNGRRRRKRVY